MSTTSSPISGRPSTLSSRADGSAATPWTALVLAGRRAKGADPFEGRLKALLPVAGDAMIAHVLTALAEVPAIGRISVLAQDCEALAGALGARFPRVAFAPSRQTIAETLLQRGAGADWPLLITTADNVLLSAPVVRHFLAAAAGADLGVGVVGRHCYAAAFPVAGRTWLRARGDAYSGANLFAFGSERALSAVRLWAAIEGRRKSAWRVMMALGPALALGALAGLLSLPGFMARASRRLGLEMRAVELPYPEAALDVDKPEDLALAERVLAARSEAA